MKIPSPGRSVGILIIFLEFSLSPISDFPGSDLVLTEVISSMTKQPAEASLTFTTKFLCLNHPTWAWLKHSNRIQGQWRLTPIRALRRGVPVAGIGGHASHGVSSPTLFWIPNILHSQPDITVRPSGTNCSAVWSFCPRSKIARWCVNTLHIRHTGTCTLCLQNSFYIFFSVWVLLSPLVFCLHQLLWLPEAGKALRTVEFLLLSRLVLQQPHFFKAAVMSPYVRFGNI